MAKFDDQWISTSGYANFANIHSTPVRQYPLFPTDPSLNFPPSQDYGARAVQRYNAESTRIDVMMYRITDRRHTDAIIAAVKRGVPVRLITEQQEYRGQADQAAADLAGVRVVENVAGDRHVEGDTPDLVVQPNRPGVACCVGIAFGAIGEAMLGEGVPFFAMGDDILRSKSMDKNSYDSGDWFNRVDWTGQSNGWRSGLPNQPDDSANWGLIKTIFADSSASPSASDIAAASSHFQEMLKIRKSSPLFRLRTKADVMSRVDYSNAGPSQVPGVIVMTITDGTCAGTDLDPARDAIVVVVNADKASHAMPVSGATGFTVHTKSTVTGASFSNGTFTVPARTTAVFEQLQSGGQGAGLPCNTH